MRPDDPMVWAENDNRSAQVIQIDAGKSLATIALCFSVLTTGLTIAAFFFGMHAVESKAHDAATQAVTQATAPINNRSIAAAERAQIAEREARVAVDKVDMLRDELKRSR